MENVYCVLSFIRLVEALMLSLMTPLKTHMSGTSAVSTNDAQKKPFFAFEIKSVRHVMKSSKTPGLLKLISRKRPASSTGDEVTLREQNCKRPKIESNAKNADGHGQQTVNSLSQRLSYGQKNRAPQPTLAMRLDAAVRDFQENPEKARKKWLKQDSENHSARLIHNHNIGSKRPASLTEDEVTQRGQNCKRPKVESNVKNADGHGQQTVNSPSQKLSYGKKYRAPQPTLAMRLGAALRDFQENPEEARKKWLKQDSHPVNHG
ncbi:hypothetical protein N7836_001957 [Vibrio vulnificus]|nr:hypothetical protein [Vibrio vulnificus]